MHFLEDKMELVKRNRPGPTEFFTFIERWYNPHRRHSALGNQAPMKFEKQHPTVA